LLAPHVDLNPAGARWQETRGTVFEG